MMEITQVDWTDIEQVRAFFRNDVFATESGAVIEQVSPGEALCSLIIQPRHKNAAGILQGGVTFTLADFAFAVAANATHPLTVSLSNQINFLKPPKGSRLLARASRLSSGKNTCCYQVTVTDELGTSIAHMTVNGFIRST